MFLVGLTGGIATGKSTVSKKFTQLGCMVIDADIIAREVVEPGKRANRRIREEFGETVFNEDGTLNRVKLGEIVFSDEGKRKLLNQITHPEVHKAMLWRLIWAFLRGKQFVVMDVPLLFESKSMLRYMSYVVVVFCDSKSQLQRLQGRNTFSADEALRRINAQLPLADKVKGASHIIDNTGSVEDAEQQVEKLYLELKQSKRHWMARTVAVVILTGVIWSFSKLLTLVV